MEWNGLDPIDSVYPRFLDRTVNRTIECIVKSGFSNIFDHEKQKIIKNLN